MLLLGKISLGLLAEQFERELPRLTDDADLEAIALEQGAVSFETLMKELGLSEEFSDR